MLLLVQNTRPIAAAPRCPSCCNATSQRTSARSCESLLEEAQASVPAGRVQELLFPGRVLSAVQQSKKTESSSSSMNRISFMNSCQYLAFDRIRAFEQEYFLRLSSSLVSLYLSKTISLCGELECVWLPDLPLGIAISFAAASQAAVYSCMTKAFRASTGSQIEPPGVHPFDLSAPGKAVLEPALCSNIARLGVCLSILPLLLH